MIRKLLLCALWACGLASAANLPVAVLISAHAEWEAVKPLYKGAVVNKSPFGEYFFANVQHERVLFFEGGWGKVAAAGSTQYVIDHFKPGRLINLGTCGGVEGRVKRFDVVAPDRVVIYDISETMGDFEAAIARYSTSIALPAQLPVPVVKTTMYSADRDLDRKGLQAMESKYHPVAADWESGSIAWVAQKNGTPLLILRGVSDLISVEHAEAEGDHGLWVANAGRVMRGLVEDLPKWVAAFQ
jgi:adenosylhomocysteine nucleosidase